MSESPPVTPPEAGPPSAAASVPDPAAGSAVEGTPDPREGTPGARRRPEPIDVAVWVFLAAISYIRHRYMDTPFLSATLQVMVGGALVFITGILIGSS